MANTDRATTPGSSPEAEEIRIDPARQTDVPAMMAILNHEIETSVRCFRTKPMTQRDADQWWRAREQGRYPAWVATCQSVVLGWASLSRWSAYEAYEGAVELSIWLQPQARGRGLGSRLLETAVTAAEAQGRRVVLSRVESQNKPSLRLHQRYRFREVGTLRNVGEKFGKLLDVVILELQLPVIGGDDIRPLAK